MSENIASIIADWFGLDPQNPYGSHRHALAKVMLATHGPVLELGMGNFSTPFIARLCETQDRQFWSYETEPTWHANFAKLASDRVHVQLVDRYADDDMHARWSVAFVDHAPDALRAPALIMLANLATFVVIHDTNPGNGYGAAWPHYKWKRDHTSSSPHTSILSNTIDPARLDE